MWKFLKEYFSFTRTELRIILILSVLLFAVLSFRLYLRFQPPPLNNPSDEELRLVEEFIASLDFKDSETRENVKIKIKEEIFYTHLKKFDPNKVTVKDLTEMGFPENVISNLSKYKRSGGHFFKPQEFKKIYGVTDSAYKIIAPYITIMDTVRKEKIFPGKSVQSVNKVKIININTADSSDLVTLKGIGPGFALRIIKYRQRLGGFIFPEQLLEIYGMDSTRFDLFREEIYIDTTDVQKMNINLVSYSELIKHPYLDENTAASIIKFRDFKGQIKDIRELQSYNIIKNDKLQKLEPYLCVSRTE